MLLVYKKQMERVVVWFKLKSEDFSKKILRKEQDVYMLFY
jgi:hypothetical protein